MKRQNVRTLSLIVCTFTYLLIGAAIFDAMESTNEVELAENYTKMLEDWIRRYNISARDFHDMQNVMPKRKAYLAGTQWKFAGSLYFATTVITTIGYGHSTPKTEKGKVFCMIYALPGIPLCIVMFQSIGERMNALLTYLLKHIKKCLGLRNRDVSQTNLIFVSTNLCVIVATTGAAAFSHFESWTYLDSFYYCFITLTTIGFGDFVALQRDDSLTKFPEYVAFSLLFILFGLTVVSSAMNLLVLRFLTMNTEDERRDELEACAAAHNPLRLEGDVILNINGPVLASSIVEGERRKTDWSERTSVCSCTCYHVSQSANKEPIKIKKPLSKRIKRRLLLHSIWNTPNRYTRYRSPGLVVHLAQPKLDVGRQVSAPEHYEASRMRYAEDQEWVNPYSIAYKRASI